MIAWLVAGSLIAMGAGSPLRSAITLAEKPVTCELTLPKLTGPKDHYALRISGISAGPGEQALFRVFADMPDAGRATPSTSEHYVGPVTILAGPSKNPKNVIMPFQWPHRRSLPAGSKVPITLVPLSDTSAHPIHIENMEITVTRPER